MSVRCKYGRFLFSHLICISVRNVFLRCGHAQNLPDQMIYCDSETCKFSPRHPPNCTPPKCRGTCWQYRQYPEQHSPNIDSVCPACARAVGMSRRPIGGKS
ncbi:hypothetical protein FISHEDRAFT_47616 [Fistulina hepatica ATCC 64428]|uniref:Uncharacterized protein n=1 Tax=Fistulina hepatica ATCC 64428 TaxID=1128425 RepID=A0A0D7A5Z4_9AGAR|nr:hypothetical protein FISHEDRAFT_47616 [Fistulina hepatica ATCC 64428]